MTTFKPEDFEMAARAFGHECVFNLANAPQLWKGGEYVCFWNPPDNDGDSRRLQVACGIALSIDDDAVDAQSYQGGIYGTTERVKDHGGDICKAARYAVFKRAIALGRAMSEPDARPNKSDAAQLPSVAAPDQQIATLFRKDELL